MANIDIFLAPDRDTIAQLDTALVTLRGAGGAAAADHAFQVATILLSHSRADYVAEGVALMERLAFAAWRDLQSSNGAADNKLREAAPAGGEGDALRSNRALTQLDKERARNRETLVFGYFLLGVGQYKLGDEVAARNSVERMLELEPHHPQGVALRNRIDEVTLRNAAYGAAAVAVGVVGVAALLRRLFK